MSVKICIEVEAGRLLWNSLRNAVLSANQHGHDLTLTEGKGFLSRPFYIRGNSADVMLIMQWIDRIQEEAANGQEKE